MGVFLMVIHGSDGDLLPMLRIGRALRARDHDVTILTHARYSNRIRQAGLAFIPVDMMSGASGSGRGNPDVLRQVAGELSDAPRHLAAISEFVPQLRFECRALLRRHRPGQTVLVSGCPLNMSALTVGEALGAPVACLAIAPQYLLAIPDQAPVLAATLGDDVASARAELGLPPVTDWSAWMLSADTYLGLWPEWFEEAGPAAPVRTRLTGFVLPDAGEGEEFPPAAAALLAGSVRPILVTGGTSQMLHGDFYPVALAACTGLDRPVLLVAAQRDLPDGPLPPNVHWFPRLPFATVISQAAAVLHHGGLSTTARAAVAGVPQVVLGYGFDRVDNGARLAGAGAGAFLPADEWHPDRVRRLLDTALSTARPAPRPIGRVDDPGAHGADPVPLGADPVALAADPVALAADELERLAARRLPGFAARAGPATR